MALALHLALWEPWASPVVLREDLYLFLCPGVTAGVSGVKMGLAECKAGIFNLLLPIPGHAPSSGCLQGWAGGLGSGYPGSCSQHQPLPPSISTSGPHT